MDKPPTFWERLINEREIYLNFFRAGLRERARLDNLVFTASWGTFCCRRHRTLSKFNRENLETRIQRAMERHKLDRAGAKSHIEKPIKSVPSGCGSSGESTGTTHRHTTQS